MITKPYPPTPELDKMKDVQPQSQIIGQFLDWLFHEKHRTIAEIPDGMEKWQPVGGSIESILAEYFEIDVSKVENERRAILESIRA